MNMFDLNRYRKDSLKPLIHAFGVKTPAPSVLLLRGATLPLDVREHVSLRIGDVLRRELCTWWLRHTPDARPPVFVSNESDSRPRMNVALPLSMKKIKQTLQQQNQQEQPPQRSKSEGSQVGELTSLRTLMSGFLQRCHQEANRLQGGGGAQLTPPVVRDPTATNLTPDALYNVDRECDITGETWSTAASDTPPMAVLQRRIAPASGPHVPDSPWQHGDRERTPWAMQLADVKQMQEEEREEEIGEEEGRGSTKKRKKHKKKKRRGHKRAHGALDPLPHEDVLSASRAHRRQPYHTSVALLLSPHAIAASQQLPTRTFPKRVRVNASFSESPPVLFKENYSFGQPFDLFQSSP